MTITVPAWVRSDMIRLGISPTHVAVKAFRKEARARELLERWRRARLSDPNLTVADIIKESKRIRRLLGE